MSKTGGTVAPIPAPKQEAPAKKTESQQAPVPVKDVKKTEILPKTDAAPPKDGDAASTKCNCSDKESSSPYFRCTGKKSSDYCVCYPDSFGQTPVSMQCASGTHCVSEGKFIYCL